MDRESIKNIFKLLSLVGLMINLFFLIPIFTGIYYNENISNFTIYTISTTILFLTILFTLKTHSIKMKIKDAILSVNLVWIMISSLGAIPLMLMTHITFIDGFFESASGFTTTGATIYSDITNLPKTVLMLRSTMHWIGGMGIIVLGVGLLSFINPSGSLTLFKSESTGISADRITPKLKDTAIKLWIIYLSLTFINMLLLKIEGMSFFDAINHAFATISTGGFSTKSESMGYWIDNPYILWTTTFFMFISGINFIAHIKFLKGDYSGYKSEEVKWYIVLVIILSLIVSLVHYLNSNDPLFFALTNGFFTIVSVITTTGFATLDYSQWGPLAISIIFIAMLIGGNAGSTAGGIKIIRFIVMFKNLIYQLKKILSPNAIFSIKIDNTKLSNNIINNVSAFIFLYILTTVSVTLYLFANHYDMLTSISAAIACVGNIGPGFGHVGPVDNFGFFTQTQKFILSIAMIIGRLEFYTVLILLTKNFWKKF
jgi:trk system potassium uptake protein TrkH